jgi:hypothetical protein
MSAPGPQMIRHEDQMVGLTVVMPLSTFSKLKAQAGGEDMRLWSNQIIKLIERSKP